MSALIVAAHFVVLLNGVPVQVESVTLAGSQCPQPLHGSVPLFNPTVSRRACEGMVWEAGVLRYWTLTPRNPSVPAAGWRGWQTRVAAKDFAQLQANNPPSIGFPQSTLSFELR